MRDAEEIVVGIVGRPWGRKGQFLVNPRGTDPEFLLSRRRLRLRPPGRSTVDYPILSSHFASGRLVVEVEGCASTDMAESLRGSEVLALPAEFAPAPAGSFYPHELVGLNVVLKGGAVLGSIEEVLDSKGPDLLVVRAGQKRILVPFVEAICRVASDEGVVEIDPPAGLLELGQ